MRWSGPEGGKGIVCVWRGKGGAVEYGCKPVGVR